jgi:hypothetical protein
MSVLIRFFIAVQNGCIIGNDTSDESAQRQSAIVTPQTMPQSVGVHNRCGTTEGAGSHAMSTNVATSEYLAFSFRVGLASIGGAQSSTEICYLMVQYKRDAYYPHSSATHAVVDCPVATLSLDFRPRVRNTGAAGQCDWGPARSSSFVRHSAETGGTGGGRRRTLACSTASDGLSIWNA